MYPIFKSNPHWDHRAARVYTFVCICSIIVKSLELENIHTNGKKISNLLLYSLMLVCASIYFILGDGSPHLSFWDIAPSQAVLSTSSSSSSGVARRIASDGNSTQFGSVGEGWVGGAHYLYLCDRTAVSRSDTHRGTIYENKLW